MSNIVWSATDGWHDGPEVSLELDSAGRLAVKEWFGCESGQTCLWDHTDCAASREMLS